MNFVINWKGKLTQDNACNYFYRIKIVNRNCACSRPNWPLVCWVWKKLRKIGRIIREVCPEKTNQPRCGWIRRNRWSRSWVLPDVPPPFPRPLSLSPLVTSVSSDWEPASHMRSRLFKHSRPPLSVVFNALIYFLIRCQTQHTHIPFWKDLKVNRTVIDNSTYILARLFLLLHAGRHVPAGPSQC